MVGLDLPSSGARPPPSALWQAMQELLLNTGPSPGLTGAGAVTNWASKALSPTM
ncbi:hypothetical protein D3C86_1146810 [compost metagenome]